MLAHRIATALVLLVMVIVALAAPGPWPFAMLLLAMVAASAWEWARLCGMTGRMPPLVAAAVLVAVLAGSWAATSIPSFEALETHPLAGAPTWWAIAAAWIVGGAWMLSRGVDGWRSLPRSVQWATGLLVLVTTWWSTMLAYAAGINFMMSVMMLVWASDIAAYFGGRGFGGRIFGPRKLAPTISPGKTWEGALSGLVGALLLALVWVWWVDPHWPVDAPSLYTRMVEANGWWYMAAVVFVLTGAGIVGDLVESLLKRAAGAKDSSSLLPGHGGVLDRVDALLPVMPMAWAVAASTGL